MRKLLKNIATYMAHDYVIRAVVMLVFAYLLGVHTFHSIQNTDIFFHVRCGEDMLSTGKIIVENLYSFTSVGYEFSNHAWLSKVAFALLYRCAQEYGLIFFCCLMATIVLLPIIKTVLTCKRRTWYILYFLLVSGVILMSSRFLIRPQLFSFLFFSIYIHILIACMNGRGKKRMYALIPLQLLWNQFHAMSVLGILVIGAFVLEQFVRARVSRKKKTIRAESRRLYITGAGMLLTYAGVYRLDLFVRMYIDLFTGYRDFWFGIIHEFLPFELTGLFFLFVVVSAVVCIRARKRGDYALTFLYGFFLLWTVAVSRNIAYFVLLSLIIAGYRVPLLKRSDVSPWLGRLIKKKKRWWSAAAALTAVWLAIIHSVYADPGWHDSGINTAVIPVAACSFINENDIVGNGYNEFAAGSYLTFGYDDKREVFVHNQVEAYSPAFLKKYLRAYRDKEVMGACIQEYDLRYAIIRYRTIAQSMITWFVQSPAWKLVFLEDATMIFVRDVPENKAVIERFHITDTRVALSRSDLRQALTVAEASARHTRTDPIGYRPYDLKDPRNEFAQQYMRANMFADCYMYRRAERLLITCVQARPKDRALLIHLSRLYGLMNDLDKLTMVVAYATERGIDDPEFLYAYGASLITLGHVEAANEILRLLEVLRFPFQEQLIREGQKAFEAAFYRRAEYFYRAADLYGENPQLTRMRIEVYRQLQDTIQLVTLAESYHAGGGVIDAELALVVSKAYRDMTDIESSNRWYTYAFESKKKES